MKTIQLIGLILGAMLFVSCESTQTTGNSGVRGNAEAKRIAVLEERQKEEAHMDESQKNLWNAQQDILNRDGDPTGRYTP